MVESSFTCFQGFRIQRVEVSGEAEEEVKLFCTYRNDTTHLSKPIEFYTTKNDPKCEEEEEEKENHLRSQRNPCIEHKM